MVTSVVSLGCSCLTEARWSTGVWVIGSAAEGLGRISGQADLCICLPLHLSPESSPLPACEGM